MATNKKLDCRYCQCCKPLEKDFKKIVTLKNSGLLLYIHDNSTSSKWSGNNKGSIILHNTSDRDLKRYDYIAELCQYKTNCYHCKMLIQRARSLLEDMTIIRRNEVLGVCELCKRSHRANKCKRCEYIVDKFINDKVRHYEDHQELMKSWLCKVRKFLLSIIEGRITCRHLLTDEESESKTQLNALLNLLKSTSPIRDIDVEIFPKSDTEDQVSVGHILDKMVSWLKPESLYKDTNMFHSSFDTLFEKESICICRYLLGNKSKPSLTLETPLDKNILDKKLLGSSNIDTKMGLQNKDESSEIRIINTINPDFNEPITKKNEIQQPKNKVLSKSSDVDVLSKSGINKSKNLQNQSLKTKINTNSKVIIKNAVNDKSTIKIEPQPRVDKHKSAKSDKDLQEMLKMLKKNIKKQNEKALKVEPQKITPIVGDLPSIKRQNKKKEIGIKISESFVECRSKHGLQPLEMIKGNEVVEFDSQYRNLQVESIKPLLFKTEDFIMPEVNKSYVSSPPLEGTKGTKQREKKRQDYSGVITYQLSNREFIDKGWTKLPTTKVMRRMNVYKMKPSEYNWFATHKDKKIHFYDTGEKLAEINDNGCGKWFYKNGNIAMDYHNAKEVNIEQRCVVYSSGDLDEAGKKKPVTILACFDKLGSGVIYDHWGNYRLKYNQSEGIVIDPKIGPPGRWKWHTLNDPPVLQKVFINTFVKSPLLEGPSSPASSTKNCKNDDMYAIEIKNFLNEKATKMLQKFKPFQIRMKVIKMNDYLSIRIIDQANIYILYRCGQICLKFNVGMILLSNEIIDMDVADVSEVSTPYDQKLPRSGSLQAINNIISRAKKSKYKPAQYLKFSR